MDLDRNEKTHKKDRPLTIFPVLPFLLKNENEKMKTLKKLKNVSMDIELYIVR